MLPRAIKKNHRLNLVRRPRDKSIRRNWPVGEIRLLSIPVLNVSSGPKLYRNLAGKYLGGKSYSKVSSARHHTRRYVIAAVRRTPNGFLVLDRAIGVYPEKDPGEVVIKALLKQFREDGLKDRVPEKITPITVEEIG